MPDGRPESKSAGGREEVFSRRLSEFAETGCRILVTGEVPPEATARHMRHALGERRGARYGQVVVCSRDAGRVLPSGVSRDDSTVRVIGRERYRQSAASPQGSETTKGPSLDKLRNEIWKAIDEIHTDYRPEDVRVTVDALGELFDEFAFERVVRFVEDVSRHVTLIDGRAYYYVNRPDGSELVEELSEVVDGRVELRYDRGTATTVERWHLPANG